MWDLVGNPEDRFSRVAAHLIFNEKVQVGKDQEKQIRNRSSGPAHFFDEDLVMKIFF